VRTISFKEWKLWFKMCGHQQAKELDFQFFGEHLSSYFKIWNMKHWRLMKIGQIELWFKHDSKLGNNVEHNTWIYWQLSRKGQVCWGQWCQILINPILVLKMIQHILSSRVHVLCFVWSHWISHLLLDAIVAIGNPPWFDPLDSTF
jgi:hypothetical protein